MSALHILLFIVYLAGLTWLIVRLPFFKKSGLKPAYLVLFFLIRVVASVVHNLAALAFYPRKGDIWEYFGDGKMMKADLIASPAVFFGKYFNTGANGFWSYFQYSMIETLNMLLDFISFDNMYINSLIFSFFVFAGSIALFRMFLKVFEGKVLPALTALLVPSTVYWTACIHKDGILFCLLGFLLLSVATMIEKGVSIRNLLLSFILLLGVGVFRSYVLLGLLIPLLIWWAAAKWNFSNRNALLFGVGLMLAGLICSTFFEGRVNVLNTLAMQHGVFNKMQGGSKIYFPVLQPTALSFLACLPYAFLNGFVQPLPGVGGQMIYLIFSAELMVIWFLVIWSLVRKGRRIAENSFSIACLTWVALNFLLIGYTVPFAGTIIRYRSIFLPFLLAPFLLIFVKVDMVERINTWLKRRLFLMH